MKKAYQPSVPKMFIKGYASQADSPAILHSRPVWIVPYFDGGIRRMPQPTSSETALTNSFPFRWLRGLFVHPARGKKCLAHEKTTPVRACVCFAPHLCMLPYSAEFSCFKKSFFCMEENLPLFVRGKCSAQVCAPANIDSRDDYFTLGRSSR